jgi:ABC-type transport system involved in cytochrome c biogenesis permease subunit
MKRWLPLLALLGGLAAFGVKLLPPRSPAACDVVGFGRLPILADGRIKPMDTLARTSLLQIQHSQTVVAADGTTELTPDQWLLDVFFRPERADTYPTFVLDNPDLLSLFDLRLQDGRDDRYFSYRQLEPHLAELEQQAKLADPVDADARTAFQRGVLQLYGNLVLYRELEHTLQVPGSQDFLGELMRFQQTLPSGVDAVRAKEAGQPHDEPLAQAMVDLGQRYSALAAATDFLAIPPAGNATGPSGWTTTGQAILESFHRGYVDPSVLAYAGLGYAWRHDQPKVFNHLLGLYRATLARRFAPVLAKASTEVRFNFAAPFSVSLELYVLAFLLAIISWLKWPEALGRAAFVLVALAWLGATGGILTRMFLDGRPPVTNLYSSALFVGWGAVLLCLVLEWIYRNAIGSAAGGMIGFCTLLIAQVLSFSGDTLEMMRAVLDSNFWLATHVVVVTTGYASTFLAGFLALIYIFRGIFTRSLDRATADSLTRMVYGIVCFATLFSFVGTVLGGIWADQSWGRFWGWDPKENGALIIVLWNALILHARWGGLIKPRGLMCLAVFGNIVTSWSWFGVNMLGIGLHSYGFTEAAFWWLSLFVASQLAIIALANLPLSKWRSFAPRNGREPGPA